MIEQDLERPNLRRANSAHEERSDAEIDAALASYAAGTGSRDPVSYSAKELQILELYDQLKDIELHKAVVLAQINISKEPLPSVPEQDGQSQLIKAQRDLLEARAAFTLRESVIENVIQADPVLKAVHSGPNANRSERMLHPLIDQRDILAMAQTNLSSALQSTLNATTMVQADNIKAMRRNQDIAATLLGLADKLKTQDLESIDDIELRKTLETKQAETKEAKRRFRYLKTLASGVVSGSGVDWATDEALRELVLDDED